MEGKEERKEKPAPETLGHLFLSDVDGTLLIDGRVRPADAAAIRRWKEAGNAFGLVTGRGEAFCRELCASMGVEPDVLVTDNGAAVFVKETCIHQSWMDAKAVTRALDRLPGWPQDYVPFVTMADGWHRFCRRRMGQNVMERMQEVQAHLRYFSPQDLEDLLASVPAVPGLSLYVWKDGMTSRVLDAVRQAAPEFQWHQTSHDYVEACASDKAQAMQALLEAVPCASVCYIGDGPNDLPVLDELPDSFVMETAPAMVKERGNRVTDSVAAAIERKFEDVS